MVRRQRGKDGWTSIIRYAPTIPVSKQPRTFLHCFELGKLEMAGIQHRHTVMSQMSGIKHPCELWLEEMNEMCPYCPWQPRAGCSIDRCHCASPQSSPASSTKRETYPAITYSKHNQISPMHALFLSVSVLCRHLASKFPSFPLQGSTLECLDNMALFSMSLMCQRKYRPSLCFVNSAQQTLPLVALCPCLVAQYPLQ